MKRIFLLLFVFVALGTEAIAQTRNITGRVLDENGQGLPGAGISVRGTTTGTVTDVDGNFTLDLPEGRNVIVVQSIGYNSQTVTVTGNTVTVRMSVSAQQLEGTVVTALAIRREKRELGYATSTISSEELNQANTISPLSALQGKVSGANITSTTGGPNSSTRVVLRGEKSLTGNNNALIVVDGIPINNGSRLEGPSSLSQIDFGNKGNDINPEDIESMSVLKGAAAAALYGSEAANGALIITTKSGASRRSRKKMEMSFKTAYTLSNILKLPDFQNQYGQGDVLGFPTDRRENFSWGLPFDGQMRPWGQAIDGEQKVKPYVALPDNVRNFFNTGTTWENTLSLTGGGENSSFYLSIGALNNKGVIPHNFVDRYSIRFNGTTNLTNRFYASFGLNYITTNQRVDQSGQGQGSVWNNVLQTPRDIPITEGKDLSDKFNAYGAIDENGVARYGFYGAYSDNPYWIAENFDNRNKSDRFLGNINLGFKFSDELNLLNRFGGDVVSDRFYIKQPKFNYLPYDPFYIGNDKIYTGGYFQGFTNSVNYTNDLMLTYDKDFNPDLSFSALIGHNVTQRVSDALSADIDPATNALAIPGFYNFSNYSSSIQAENLYNMQRKIGVYGSARVAYRRMLFLEVTGRNDWSSTLRPGLRSYFYPSVNASWVFTELLKGNLRENILNYGKLRASWASVGNDALAYANNLTGFQKANPSGGFGTTVTPFGGIPAFTQYDVLGLEDLKPERSNSFDLGIELSFLQNRINFDFTYYQSNTIDQIVPINISPSSGFAQRYVNAGEVENKGIEIGLRGTPLQTATGFKWDIFATYTKNQNKVLSLPGGVDQVVLGGFSGMSIVAAVGKTFGEFYATDIRRDEQGRVIVRSRSALLAGDGLPELTTTPVYLGSFLPKFQASWGTTLSYKSLSLNILFDTKQGGKFFSQTKDVLDFVGVAEETGNREPYVWPNSVYLDANGEYVENKDKVFSPYLWYVSVIPAGQHVLDASYVKLREASLTWTLPERWLGRTPFGSAQLSAYGNNLFIWTAAENKFVDPEVNSGGATNEQGFDFYATPSIRNYGFSLRVTF